MTIFGSIINFLLFFEKFFLVEKFEFFWWITEFESIIGGWKRRF